jgi:hypothetical protein
MKKKEIRAKATELLSAGVAKRDVFTQLSGQGAKDRQLAYFIASYADPYRCGEHERKVNVLITLMFIQAAIAFLMGLAIGARIWPNAKWIVGVLLALIPLSFAWGFYKDRVGAYNLYILLTVIQVSKSFAGFTSAPIGASVDIAIGIGLLTYVSYVRSKLFPDFLLMTPKKVKGQYVFES